MTKVRRIKTSGDDLLQLSSIPGVESHPELNEGNAKQIESFDHTYSTVDVFGRVWAIGGILEYKPGVHEAWFMVDPKAGHHMLSITRIIKEELSNHAAEEIEAWVELSFDRGHRFMGMLGFKLQAPDKSRDREGLNYARYILSKKDGTC